MPLAGSRSLAPDDAEAPASVLVSSRRRPNRARPGLCSDARKPAVAAAGTGIGTRTSATHSRRCKRRGPTDLKLCAREAAEKNSASKLSNPEAVSQFGGDSA